MSDEQTSDERPDDDAKHDGDAAKRKGDGGSGDDASDGDAGEKDESSTGDKAKNDRDDADGKGDGTDEDNKQKPSLFRKPIFWIILIAVVVVLAVAGILYWLHARKFESTDNAFVDAHIVRIAPEVAGRLTAVADVDNRHVRAGRLLAVISAGSSDAQLAQAQANVRQAEAQYAEALAQVTAARATAAQTAANARAPLANAIKAAQDLSRYEQLARLDRNAVAGQQLDQARANARATAAQAVAARREIASAAAQIGVADRQAQAARAVIGARRAAVDAAGVTIGDLRIRAPVAGQVVNRQVNLGSYVSPGTQLMAIIPDRTWVTANFKETQLTLMRIGQHVMIKVDAFPDVEFEGRVDSIQRGAGQAFALLPPQNATGNYVKVVQRVPVRIEFDLHHGPDPRRYPIGPGMSVVPTVKVR